MNKLSKEKSEYLLQHSSNPVDWYPWGQEAFDKAAELNRPIFLSIGYSTCHWCHVMEHESFEDEQVAELLNNNFIFLSKIFSAHEKVVRATGRSADRSLLGKTRNALLKSRNITVVNFTFFPYFSPFFFEVVLQ